MSRCMHDMDPTWCSICKRGLAKPAPTEPTVEYSLAARFDSHCRGCNLPIAAGQRISRLSDDTYVHEGCE